MKEKERIHAYVDVKKGKTVCVCLYDDKRCDKDCEACMLERDRFEGWQKMFARNKYGK